MGRLGLFPLLFAQGSTIPPTPHLWEFLTSKDNDVTDEGVGPQCTSSAGFPTLFSLGWSDWAVGQMKDGAGEVSSCSGSPPEVPEILYLKCLARLQSFLQTKKSMYFK